MKELEKHLNYSLIVYDEKGGEIEEIYGGKDCGYWLTTPDGPLECALFILDYDKISEYLKKNGLLAFRAGRIPYDKKETYDGKYTIAKKYPEKEENGVLVEIEIEAVEQAIDIAKDLNLDFFYWIYWDYARVIKIVDVLSKEMLEYCDGDTYSEQDI